MAFVLAAKQRDPALDSRDLVEYLAAQFGLSVHPRSVERALARKKNPVENAASAEASTMISQQRLIDEYESLRRQSLERPQRTTQLVTLALQAVMEGGMVGFMRCCNALLKTRPAGPDAARPIRQVAVSKTSLPAAELTHALAAMVLAIVSQELRP